MERNINNSPIGVIRITANYGAVCIDDLDHIALQIGDVVISGTVMLYGVGGAIGVIEEIQNVGIVDFPQQFPIVAIVVGVGMLAVLSQVSLPSVEVSRSLEYYTANFPCGQ